MEDIFNQIENDFNEFIAKSRDLIKRHKTPRKAPKHIEVTIYTTITKKTPLSDCKGEIRRIGGNIYLITKQRKEK